jgi:hypothetical protein
LGSSGRLEPFSERINLSEKGALQQVSSSASQPREKGPRLL